MRCAYPGYVKDLDLPTACPAAKATLGFVDIGKPLVYRKNSIDTCLAAVAACICAAPRLWALPVVRQPEELTRMSTLFSKRFRELEDQLAPSIALSLGLHAAGAAQNQRSIDADFVLNWSVKAKNLIANSCGEDSQHFKAFEKAQKFTSGDNNFSVLRRLTAVFLAAKEDFEGGYVKSIRSLIQAEVFEDELEQAAELLSSGYVPAAAVISGIVLESKLRSLCLNNNIPIGKMDKMNVDLTKAGVHNMIAQKKITALAAIRNSAAHGKSNEFTSADVQSMIEEVRRYVQ